MYVDLPAEDEVRALLDVTGTTCVSIYMPTTPEPDDADAERLAFKNLASEAVDQLRGLGLDKRELAAFADALGDVDDDPFFWRQQARSLAVFIAREEMHVYRLANRLEQGVTVADRFQVKPLLRVGSFHSAGFVLRLSQGGVSLVEFGDDYGPLPVEVDDLPTDMSSFMETVPGASGFSDGGVQSPEGHESRLRKYARQVDRALRSALRGVDAPVVLAATDPLASVFRSISTMENLADGTISGNPEQIAGTDLVASAREIVDRENAGRLAQVLELFDLRVGQDRTATDLADLARAATHGAVETLLVDIDRTVSGTIGDDGALSLDDGADTYDVVDELARRVLATGGTVVAVRADDVPQKGPAAAILRYA